MHLIRRNAKVGDRIYWLGTIVDPGRREGTIVELKADGYMAGIRWDGDSDDAIDGIPQSILNGPRFGWVNEDEATQGESKGG